jgi:hypothetical protein
MVSPSNNNNTVMSLWVLLTPQDLVEPLGNCERIMEASLARVVTWLGNREHYEYYYRTLNSRAIYE